MADNKNKSNSGKKKSPFSVYWIYAVVGIALIGANFYFSSGSAGEVKHKETFYELAVEGNVRNVTVINRSRVDFKLTEDGKDFVKGGSGDDYDAMKRTLREGRNISSSDPDFTCKIGDLGDFEKRMYDINQSRKENETSPILIEHDEEVNYFSSILGFMLPIIILIAIWIFVMRRMSGGGGGGGGAGQIFNIGKSRAKVYEKGESTDITFDDVAGLKEAKVEVEEIVEFLKTPKKYTKLGAKIPKGALLVGPPGTGKTLLAKAVAGEAKVPFFSLSGSDFVEMFVGVGASRVRDLFKQAKEKAPSIIFIDEIDAIGRARGKNNSFGSNDERENTLNQLLTEMDGFGTNSGVIILAATNRADVLDQALMRAGRFDRQIYVDMPDINERNEIFKVHLKPIKTEDNLDVEFLAKQTPGFSGADIANLCNEAALIAARSNKDVVEKQDFLDAVDRIVGGLEKKNKIITPSEKRAIAFHEAGHATVSWLLEHAHPLVKVTIVPRGQSLGAAWYLPEERSITTTEQILDDMCSALGGRAAEQITFGKISTGALSDLEKVTKQAYAMVSVYGLNDKLGNISYYDPHGNNGFTKPYSDHTARIIDEEASSMIEKQYDRALALLTEHKEELGKLANRLLESEVIFKEDLEAIFGKRKWQAEVGVANGIVKEDVAKETEVKEESTSTNDASATDSKDEKSDSKDADVKDTDAKDPSIKKEDEVDSADSEKK
ncbi:MAG: ATP-dependent metalloprotease FtsH [Flavobacteriaceae bacterium]|jgi:ATP-dependent metalloprotease FtsH